MGQKPWVQKDEPKTASVGYSRSLMKLLFYFIWLFGSTNIYSFSWKKIEKINHGESWDQNYGLKTMTPKPHV